jgi:hypothetical protein
MVKRDLEIFQESMKEVEESKKPLSKKNSTAFCL